MNSSLSLLNIVFHIGRGKTGTTLLQSLGNQLQDVIYVGKGIDGIKNNFLGNLNVIHNELFPSLRGEIIGGFSNPSKNNMATVSHYVDELEKIIHINPEAQNLILSDECISDYQNYLGEQNTLLIIAIGNLLESRLSDRYHITKNITMTIRNQVDLIQSFYSYSGGIRISFSNFLERSFLYQKESFFGSLFFNECRELYESVAGKDWNINLIPYEILSIDGNTKEYIKQVFVLDDKNLIAINEESFSKKMNVNSKKINGKKHYIKKSNSLFFQLGFNILYSHNDYKKYLSHASVAKKILIISREKFGKLFLKIDFFLKKIFVYKKVNYFLICDDDKEKILKVFKDDNEKLQQSLHQFDLIKYGYLKDKDL